MCLQTPDHIGPHSQIPQLRCGQDAAALRQKLKAPSPLGCALGERLDLKPEFPAILEDQTDHPLSPNRDLGPLQLMSNLDKPSSLQFAHARVQIRRPHKAAQFPEPCLPLLREQLQNLDVRRIEGHRVLEQTSLAGFAENDTPLGLRVDPRGQRGPQHLSPRTEVVL